jgi:hypothetical protein
VDVEKGPNYEVLAAEIPEDEEKRSIRLSRRLSDWSLNKGYPQVPVVEGLERQVTSEDLIMMWPHRRYVCIHIKIYTYMYYAYMYICTYLFLHILIHMFFYVY